MSPFFFLHCGAYARESIPVYPEPRRAGVFISPRRCARQGSPLLRFLWYEAGAHAVRRDPELKRFYLRKLIQKGLGKARVAVARKLGIRLWIMLRDEIDYQEFCRRGQMQQSGAACGGDA